MSTFEEMIKTRPIQDPHQRAVLNVMYTGVWLQQRMGQALKPFDISEPQYNVLRILRGQNGKAMNLYEIQNRMIQKMSNVSRLIDKLLVKKLVTRKESKDNRRRVDIAITQKGLDLLEEVEPSVQSVLKIVYDNLEAEKAAILGELLDKMRNE